MTSDASNGLCSTDLCRRSVAAGGASILSIVVTTPLDVVKTRMQAQAANHPGHYAHSMLSQKVACVGCPHVGSVGTSRWPSMCPPECYNLYLSTVDAMRKIARQEGLRVLWRGTRETMLMAVPLVGLYLPLYDTLVARMSELGTAAPIVAGASARTMSMFCVTPIEVLRVRIQAMRDDRGALGTFDWGQGRGLLQRARALWSGFGATVIRDVPFTAVYWGLMEPIRKGLSRGSDESLTDLLFANSTAGFSAGIVASILTHPMDVVKTRIQIAERSGSVPTFLESWKRIYSTEGVRGLFAGAVPRTLRIGPSCAIVISTYELLKRIL